MLHEVPSVEVRSILRLAVFGLLSLVLVACVATGSPATAEEHYGDPAEGSSCVSHCDCPPGELCQPHGDTGQCEPAACPEIFQPVCGLDGQTYGNRCQADAAHVVVAHEGECRKPEGEPCGGIQGLTCPEGKVCDLPAGMCRGADLMGVCRPQPDACPRIFRPVCGCDGKTYPNDCERLRAGAQKSHDGECST
ncbi:MAG TPA: Kazal-type serine protease inhibitor domain-containing protein [Thermoanaerobaculia bacterium]|nr:Kazal-type serine protease inhibitor domain-containing protein [Thermoanaerobaculia bacterium]